MTDATAPTKLPASLSRDSDERQPLLRRREASSDADNDDQVASDPAYIVVPVEGDQAEVIKVEDVEIGWKWYTFYTLLAIAGLVSISLLVKGFIDAGDKEFDYKKALKQALGGGITGAAAMLLQVLTLMPLRTIMNYQYRYGTSLTVAAGTLYSAGGYGRYYQGLGAALIQGPLARFGDTAANAGILALLESNPYMKTLPAFIKTVFASATAAAFRMIFTPVDTLKTTLQTQGSEGWAILRARIKMYGIGTLWYGAFATAAATFVGHYPWFGTLNVLNATLPIAHTAFQKFIRRAFIGFVASVFSDSVSNSLRVIKTYRQVNHTKIGYTAAARAVVAVDGVKGLFGRGLKTRILANGLQGVMFTVLWGMFLDLWNERTKDPGFR